MLIIEHTGTPKHTEAAHNIAAFAEDEFGITSQQIIGSEKGPITLYNEELSKVAEFDHEPDDTELYFYLSEMEE